MDTAISHFARKAQAGEVHLIGYSGGAAVAVLIAARRGDVRSLRTIAGNLDPPAVNAYHDVSSLKGSLNPAEVAGAIKGIPMRHFIGTQDKVIPTFIAQSFADRTGDTLHRSVSEVNGADHSHGWRERWRELLRLPLHREGSDS